jgi:hypothetical protein
MFSASLRTPTLRGGVSRALPTSGQNGGEKTTTSRAQALNRENESEQIRILPGDDLFECADGVERLGLFRRPETNVSRSVEA